MLVTLRVGFAARRKVIVVPSQRTAPLVIVHLLLLLLLFLPYHLVINVGQPVWLLNLLLHFGGGILFGDAVQNSCWRQTSGLFVASLLLLLVPPLPLPILSLPI